MYAITGITGRVGGAVANSLLNSHESIRAIVRDLDKGAVWAKRGCDVAIADIEDAVALARAFAHSQGVFVMSPPNYDPEPGFPQIHRRIAALIEALTRAKPDKIVFLSTVGAHVTEPTLLTNSRLIENALRETGIPTTFLRAAWFMENAQWDVESAREGKILSFLQPLDHPIPMVATADIAEAAADLLRERWVNNRIVELEAVRRYSANDIGTAFAAALHREVLVEAVPRNKWEGIFRKQGMKNPTPRMRMLDGFNEGWIDFEGRNSERRYGGTTLDVVIGSLIEHD